MFAALAVPARQEQPVSSFDPIQQPGEIGRG
jgi:hypothetical protein